ncbi:chemotaxis protein CheA [Saccharibacillus kuerlensis]|uniref:Chemotaxis protein CheA n=1 Tax=Saccharibacillus kuerlensis TaxID=459527 RepID=A0ABQ2KRN3_9BACL|nr:chemotaxis protein CheA [Saccharibacillus kuerlensis]GGN90366.1 chemotaxis protein CheA [Saccharibacillus kuerlensis]
MDMNQYLSMFIDESNDHLQSLNEKMMELESSPEDIGIVQVIFRSAHTLKGMAATMGFEDLAALTHQMENVLDLVRNDKLKMQNFIFDTLFKSLDALEAMVQDITQGGEGKADVTSIVEALQAIVRGEVPGGESASAASSETKPAAAGAVMSKEQVQLDEFQHSILEQSLAAGHRVLYIEVSIREDCQLKAARAYMVFDLLERSGEVVKSHPTVQDIEQEKFDRSFSLYFITEKEPEELHAMILNLSEIEDAKLTPIDSDTLVQLTEKQEEVKAPVEVEAASIEPAAASADNTSALVSDKDKQPAAKKVVAAPSRTIRVDIERLDVLMNLFSELLIDRVRLEQLATEIKNQELSESVEHMGRVSSDLQNIVMKLRMVAIDTVFNRFPRMVRDLAKSLGKKLDLVITGAETELDRTVIDEIGDPLVHLLRNSVDHGIESIAERIAAGKPETGTVNLRAFHSGNHVFIEIQDDGKGIDRNKILASAIKKGVVTEDESRSMTDEQVYQLLFAPGFSTAEKISDISGRGVGLDVVKSKISSLGGHVMVTSTLGEGTLFSVQLPLTLSIISAMMIRLGSEKYAIPLSSIVETGIIRKEQVRSVHGSKLIPYRDAHIPLMSLSRFFDAPDYNEDDEEETEIVVIRKGDRLAALAIDSFIGQNEIVIKNLGKYLPQAQGISGATILGDGQVALILDPNALIK